MPIRGSGGSKPKSSGSQPRAAVEAPNTLQSKNIARVIDLISEGPIGGLVNGLQSVYFDDTVLQNTDGTYNFDGVTVETREGLPDQTALPGFPAIETEEQVGTLVNDSNPIVRTINDANIDALIIKIRTPAMTEQSSNGDLNGSKVEFNIEIQPNGGTYESITHNKKWSAFTGTQTSNNASGLRVTAKTTLTGYVGTRQTGTVTVQYRLVGAGSWTTLGTRQFDEYIPSSSSQFNRMALNSYDVSATFEITGLSPDQYEFRVTSGSAVSAEELIQSPIVIQGKTTSSYEAAYRIELTGSSPWNVRVTRITPDSETITVQNDIYFSTYTKVIDAKLTYPNSAVVGLTVDAQNFGQNVPVRSYEIKGLLLQIPSNYNPETREYTGIWDGTFTTAYSDNPAWVLYDLLTNTRYGLGNDIKAANVDKYALYDIAQYCDELVDDGYGGQEPRFTFNGVLNTQRDAYQVINAITAAFRGMTYWSTGMVTAIQDSPGDAIKLVTPANVLNGLFTYSGSSLKARHTVCLVTWNDPADGYKANIEVVEDHDGIQLYGWRQTDTIAFGCTSRGQARRFGKWILDSEHYETETVTYSVGLDHYDVGPGNLVKILDPTYAAVEHGGRVAGNTSTSITSDRPVLIESGKSYTLSVVMPDGSIEDRPLTNTPGTVTTLTFTSALPDDPLPGAMWIIASTEVEPRLFRVLNMRELEKTQWEVTALFHDPTKYTRVEQDLYLEPPSYTAIRTGAIVPPTEMAIQEYLYQAGPAIKAAVTVSWAPAIDARVMFYEVAYRGPNDPDYRYYRTINGTSVDIHDTIPGDYSFRIRAMDAGGTRSQDLIGDFELRGLLEPPDPVDNFRISMVGNTTFLAWDPVPDLDLDFYVVKYSQATSGATWGSSTVLVDQISRNSNSIPVPTLVGSYLIKAVDTSGIESETETIISSTIASLANFNVISAIVESPSFSGTKDGCGLSGTNLVITGADTVDDWTNVDDVLLWDVGNAGLEDFGLYYFVGSGSSTGSSLDLGAVYTSRLTPNIVASGTDLFGNMDLWTDVDAVSNWDGGDAAQWGVVLQVRTTNDNPSGSPTWTDWQDLIVGDYTARAFQFRLFLYTYQAGISPLVSTLGVNVDMPDRVLGDNDIVSNAVGTTITYDTAFKAAPAIAIGAQNMATGDYFAITSQSASGFSIRFFNSAGTGISRTFDWVAKGYGVAG